MMMATYQPDHQFDYLTSSASYVFDPSTYHLPVQQATTDFLFQKHFPSSDWESEDEEEFDFEDDVEDDELSDDFDAENASLKLLQFLNVVTMNVRSLVERNKGSDDYCDVYEERFGSVLSGRELYYADLLELANPSRSKKNFPAPSCTVTCENSASNYGLGPLEELFTNATEHSAYSNNVMANVPMTMRKLPTSFWQEPGIISRDSVDFTSLFHSIE